MFERFTERARQVVVLAQEEARGLQHSYIGTEHILLGLLREDRGLAARALESLGVTLERAREQLLRIVAVGGEPSASQIPFTMRAKKVLERALRESLSLQHSYIGTEHILLGLLRQNEGVAVRVLRDCDVDLADLRDELIARSGGAYIPQGDEEISSGPGPAIDPGWLDGLPVLLKPLGEGIRATLGRAPDLGDLLLALVCVPHTPAFEALEELGVDVDELWLQIERARTRGDIGRQAWAKQMTGVVEAMDLAIKQGRLAEAAALRDQERELYTQAKATHWSRLATMTELRQRLDIPGRPKDA
jgi:ATP-dependent Clp protease ATP-binding subunit ClpA